MTNAALAFRNVSFGYTRHTPLLQDLSFTIAAGEAVGLIGPNGAGKTTITRLAMALLQPSQGVVTTVGQETRDRVPEQFAKDVGYLFQHPESQLFARTVVAEVGFGLRQLGIPEQECAARIQSILELVGLDDVASEHPYDLPVPLRRMVAFATALVSKPTLLILDEPSAGLDRHLRGVVHRVLRDHVGGGGSILAVTHDPLFAAEVLHRVLPLRSGHLSSSQPIASLWADQATLQMTHPLAGIVRELALDPPDWRLPTLATAVEQFVHRSC